MFLLVPAHPGFPGQIPQSRKTVVCVCVCTKFTAFFSVTVFSARTSENMKLTLGVFIEAQVVLPITI